MAVAACTFAVEIQNNSAGSMAQFIIAKHHNGAVRDVNLRFLKERVQFTDIDGAALPISTASSKQQTGDEDAGSPPRGGEN